jgi:hypothetical protein
MKRLLHNGILVLMVSIIAALGLVSADVGAHGVADVVLQAEAPVDATATPESAAVTDLPETGRGTAQTVDATTAALDQAVTTVLVLLAAATLSLGGIALMWRYDRR